MHIANTSAEFRLDSISIDQISEKTSTFLDLLGTEKKNNVRVRLTIEEILLCWKNHFGDEKEIQFSMGSRYGRPYISLELDGEEMNPIENDQDEFGEYISRLSAQMGLSPSFVYQKGKNIVSIRLKKQRTNPLGSLLIAILAAMAVGFAGLLLPKDLCQTIAADFLTPLYETFLGVLSTIAGPMIFLSVAWGIYGIGDAATLGKIGKKMMIRFVLITAAVSTISFLLMVGFYNFKFASGGMNTAGLKGIYDLLLQIFPKNIIDPFLQGNSMQIILLATVMGCIMLILGNQTKMVATFIEQINYVIQYLMELISKIVTGFVFIVILQLIWSGSLGDITKIWKPYLLFIGVTFLLLVCVLAYVSISKKVGFVNLVKKVFPTFLIAITTASSSAAFGSNLNCCKKQLGINSKVANFGVPLSIVLFKPVTAVGFTACALYFAYQYNVQLSLVWIVTAIIVITVITVALPPIPGGALACYTVLFMQLGIPAEAVALVMVLDVFIDFVSTGSDSTFIQCELLFEADHAGMLNKEILQKEL